MLRPYNGIKKRAGPFKAPFAKRAQGKQGEQAAPLRAASRSGRAAFATDGGVGVEDASALVPSQETLGASGVKRDVGMLQRRGKLAGGEGVKGAETGVELRGSDAALAVEPAEKIGGGALAFEGIAFEAGGNQVAIGVAPGADAGHDVIEALNAGVGAAETVKTMAAFAEVDGVAQGAGLEEVERFQVWRLRMAGGAAGGVGAR